MTDDANGSRRRLRPACSPPRSSSRACCGRSSRWHARSSAQGVVDLPVRRGDGRARLRRRRGRGRAASRRAPHAVVDRDRGLGAVVPHAARARRTSQNDPRFARDVAEETGYVPQGMMAVPLLDDERVLGVLQVLDRPEHARFSLQEMELLGLFANQAAIALALLGSARRARARARRRGRRCGRREVAAALEAARRRSAREAGRALLDALARVLAR